MIDSGLSSSTTKSVPAVEAGKRWLQPMVDMRTCTRLPLLRYAGRVKTPRDAPIRAA